jgi:hypothetical protein
MRKFRPLLTRILLVLTVLFSIRTAAFAADTNHHPSLAPHAPAFYKVGSN